MLLPIGVHAIHAQQVAIDRAGDAAEAAVLASPVTANVPRMPLRQAVELLAKAAHVRVGYSKELLDAIPDSVALHVKNVALGRAFEMLLTGTQLQVVAIARDMISITPATAARTTTGIITGTVRTAKGKQPLHGATVVLDDSVTRVRTDEAGHYRFAGVAAGSHRVTVRFIGYARQTRLVTVVDDSSVSLDMDLEPNTTTLDQIVVTATGEQRAREIGHVIAHINADSLVKEAPIASVTDLLQSRVPGLQVITGSGGVAGGQVSLRLRGTSSPNLGAEPIIIVDGIRYKSTNSVSTPGAGKTEDVRGYGDLLRSPLNDLDVNSIETVEVVKGPSASALYGPDAANGVIVITTKRGKAGKTEFRWFIHPMATDVPGRPATDKKAYRAWGHDSDGNVFPGNCNLIYQYQYQICTLDSISAVTIPPNDSKYAILAKNRPTWQYGANVSGGSQTLRYYLSGDYSNQIGSLVMPAPAQQLIEQTLGVTSIPDDVRNPNALQNISLHSNVSADVTSRGTVNVTASYTKVNHRQTAADAVFGAYYYSGVTPPGGDTSLARLFSPITSIALVRTNDNANRFDGQMNGSWQALPWLTANALVGVDIDNDLTHTLLPAGQPTPSDGGFAADDRRDSQNRTMTMGLTANARPGMLSFRSSFGVQYLTTQLDGLTVQGGGLAPGSNSISTATQPSVTQFWTDENSLGSYVEEVVGLRDRIFLTGSLRLDGSTSFGEKYKPQPAPKIGLSWVASDEPFLKGTPGLTELRLRYAYGKATRYPTSGMRNGLVIGSIRDLGGQQQVIFDRTILANPLLRPERTQESEYGADATLWSRVQVGLTWFTRRATDQLQVLRTPDGMPGVWGNVSSVSAHGFEATINIPIVNTSVMRADLGFNYGYHTDKVLNLGDLQNSPLPDGTGYVVGYPTGGVFVQRILGVSDSAKQRGIVFTQDIIRDSVSRFLGVILPPQTYALTPTASLAGGYLRISAVFDRQTGFWVRNDVSCWDGGLCLGAFLTSTPLLEQAKYAGGNSSDFLERGDFTRWREMSFTVQVPPRLLRIPLLRMGFSNATVSLQGRNLALWTRFHGPDPESRSDRAFNGNAVNGIPQGRTWAFRFDITP